MTYLYVYGQLVLFHIIDVRGIESTCSSFRHFLDDELPHALLKIILRDLTYNNITELQNGVFSGLSSLGYL